MDRIEQELGITFRYPVYFTRGVFKPENSILRTVLSQATEQAARDLVVVVDEGVASAHPALGDDIAAYLDTADALTLAAPVLQVPGGERVKNDPRHVDAIRQTLHDAALCRHSYVVAVGGGAVLDAAGYAAATTHRGLRLIRIPTTVLAQDDSGVGIKTGVNAFGKKNFFGTFTPPFAVVNDFAFLPTLADRDWLSGLSEAVKAALILDPPFFDELELLAPSLVARDQAAMESVVRRSATLHLSHIATGGDPFELTSSRPLDYGHWAAHKLEQLSDYRLRHGEAVSVGIALDTTYSFLIGALSEPDWRRILGLLLAFRLPVHVPELRADLQAPDDPRSVLRGLAEFREHLGGRLTILMLRGIGQAFDVHEVDAGVMIRSIGILRRIETARSLRGAEEGIIAPLSRGTS
jgi:3-dehydroquinate synthase